MFVFCFKSRRHVQVDTRREVGSPSGWSSAMARSCVSVRGPCPRLLAAGAISGIHTPSEGAHIAHKGDSVAHGRPRIRRHEATTALRGDHRATGGDRRTEETTTAPRSDRRAQRRPQCRGATTAATPAPPGDYSSPQQPTGDHSALSAPKGGATERKGDCSSQVRPQRRGRRHATMASRNRDNARVRERGGASQVQ